LAFALGAGLLGGCGDDDNDSNGNGGGGGGGGGPTSTSFAGFFSSGSENGSLTVTINSTSLAAPFGHRSSAAWRNPLAPVAVITASGTMKPIGGSAISLTGSYNDQTDSLGLSNTTAGYTLAGAYDTTGSFDVVIGQYDGPSGTGFFAGVQGATTQNTYCGTFDSNTTATTGSWDILITGGKVGGIAFPTSGEPFAFDGTIETTGAMRNITAGDSDPGVFTLTVTGTLDTTTNTVSGTWTYDDLITPTTDSGNWSGSLCP